MSDAAAGPDEVRGAETEEESSPLGTLFLLMIYITVLAGMWGALYFILLGR